MPSITDFGGRGMHRLLYLPTLILALALTGGFATDASASGCPGPPVLASPNAGPFYIEGVVTDTGGVPCNNSGVAPGATRVADPNGNVKELGPANQTTTKVNPING